MAIAVTIPRLGWNMDEGVFAGWIKQDGEQVRAGDRVFTLEGEKATEEIESLDEGILRVDPAGPKAGDRIAVGAVIGYLTEPGESAPFGGRGELTEEEGVPTINLSPRERSDAQRPGEGAPPATSVAGAAAHPNVRLASSPRARRVARELGVDWERLQGSGRTGRVRERDVREAAAQSATPIRRAIAERMLASLRSTAPVTLTTTADLSNLVNLRNQFRTAAQATSEAVPGYTDFVVKLASAALQQHPRLAARWDDGTIVLAPHLDIGIAVDTEAGLLVPVIRDVPAMTLRGVASQSRDLVQRARAGTLTGAELRGGVFTVTNLGAFGIDAFTPIINAPECAILGMGRIQARPAATDGEVAIRDQMVLSLTFDHRIADGAPAARFLQTLVQLLESPGPYLMP